MGEITEEQQITTNIIAIDNPFDCIQFNNLTVKINNHHKSNVWDNTITSEFILIKATITPGNF